MHASVFTPDLDWAELLALFEHTFGGHVVAVVWADDDGVLLVTGPPSMERILSILIDALEAAMPTPEA